MIVLQLLARSRKVWIALVALVVKIVGAVAPQVPAEIVDAAVNLALVLITAITVEDAARKLSARAG